MKLNLEDFQARAQSSENRTTVAISKDLAMVVDRAQAPSERKWETVQRLIIAGLNAESARISA